MHSKLEKNYFLNYFWFNKWMLQFCGVLPLTKRGLFINYLVIAITLLCVGFISLPGMYSVSFKGERHVPLEKVNIISESIEIFYGGIKVVALLPHRSTMLSLYRQAERLWNKVKTTNDLRIVEPYARRGLILTYSFFGNCCLSLVSLCAAPFFLRNVYDHNGTMLVSKSLPYSAGILHNNQRIFNIWWVMQLPTGFISMMPIIAVDTATGIFILHACAHLRLLQTRFQQVSVGSPRIDKSTELVKEDCRRVVINCIGAHQEIIRFCNDIERVFRMVILIQFTLSLIVICAYGFNILVQEKGTVKYCCLLVGAIVQLLIYCWPPDNLQNESMNIGFEAFNLRWYNWVKRDKYLIEFIIVRSQKPLIITIGKFSIISLDTLSSVLTSAFSYFTLLRKVM